MNSLDIDKLKSNLRKTPGILKKEKYFNSAVLIPLIFLNGEYSLLFEKRAAGIRQGGEICFPGGEFDPLFDHNFLDTAIRETVEETGIDKASIDLIGQLDTFIGPMGVTVDSFIAIINIPNINNLSFDKNEVEKLFTVPISFFVNTQPDKYFVKLKFHPEEIDKNGNTVITFPAEELKLPSRYSKPWHGRKHEIFVYKTNGEIIWGITAELIREIIDKISI